MFVWRTVTSKRERRPSCTIFARHLTLSQCVTPLVSRLAENTWPILLCTVILFLQLIKVCDILPGDWGPRSVVFGLSPGEIAPSVCADLPLLRYITWQPMLMLYLVTSNIVLSYIVNECCFIYLLYVVVSPLYLPWLISQPKIIESFRGLIGAWQTFFSFPCSLDSRPSSLSYRRLDFQVDKYLFLPSGENWYMGIKWTLVQVYSV